MRRNWSWEKRQHFLFAAKVVAWLVYIAGVVVFLKMAFPFVFHETGDTAIAMGILVAMPASVQLIWAFNPGYFYVSRLRFTDSVKAQVSPRGSQHSFATKAGAPKLGNLAGARATDPESIDHSVVLSVRTDWDQWLFAAVKLLGKRHPVPRTGSTARLEITAERVALLVGYWRPGEVLAVPPSTVVGIWKGSEVDSIGDSRVLVLVVKRDEDVVLLPFQVHRWKSGQGSLRSVDELIARIEKMWGSARVVPTEPNA